MSVSKKAEAAPARVTVEEEQLMRGESSAQRRSGLTSLPAQLQSGRLIQRLVFSIQNHYTFPGTFLTYCFLSGAVLCQTRSCDSGSFMP